jgi:hypothetical protein
MQPAAAERLLAAQGRRGVNVVVAAQGEALFQLGV